VKRIATLLAVIALLGCPVLAFEGPISLYLAAFRKAVKQNNHRQAIYCLCEVLAEVVDKSPYSKGLNQEQLIAELKTEFNRAGLHQKATELGILKEKKLLEFLLSEMDASNPGKIIDVYSDGTFTVCNGPWDNPEKSRFFSRTRSYVCARDSSDYQKELKKYWWFKMPSAESLAKLPKYVPQEVINLGPDGAFK
jgi:hypothetical protein